MDAPSYQPTAAELAVLMYHRTLGADPDPVAATENVFGGQAGEFNDTTIVPANIAEASITLVAPQVVAVVGIEDTPDTNPVGEPVASLARLAILYLAAADLEASFFQRQTSRDQTANEYWMGRAKDILAALAAAVVATSETAGGSGVISAWFPCSPIRGAVI